jgi:hypothetical protein
MKANMGKTDKTTRIIIALVFAILVYTDLVTGIVGYILLGLAGVFILTSAFSFCPLYKLFGTNTCGRQTT